MPVNYYVCHAETNSDNMQILVEIFKFYKLLFQPVMLGFGHKF